MWLLIATTLYLIQEAGDMAKGIKEKPAKPAQARMVKEPAGRKLADLAGFIEDDLQSTELRNYLRDAFSGHRRR
jgi:hypothetical protein